MNKVIFMGRLTRDPEIRYGGPNKDICIARFGLAVDRRFKKDEEPTADFFDCTAFGRVAEFVDRWLKKGVKIVMTGRAQNNNYTNREGQKVYAIQFIAEEIEFAESKKAAQENGSYQSGGGYHTDSHGFMDIPDNVDDEDLPFN